MASLKLENVLPTRAQIETLYQQLAMRQHKISHSALPSFDEHERFVREHPYRNWSIVIHGEREVMGSVYLTYDNTIGLNLSSEVTREQLGEVLNLVYESYVPLPAVKSVRAGYFSLNVPYSNCSMQAALVELGFSEIERTFIRLNDA